MTHSPTSCTIHTVISRVVRTLSVLFWGCLSIMSGGVAAPVPFGGTPSSRSDLIPFQMEPQILTSVGKKSEGLLFRRAAGNYSYARQVLATIPIAASTLIHTLASLPRAFRSAFYVTSAFIATGILVVMGWLK